MNVQQIHVPISGVLNALVAVMDLWNGIHQGTSQSDQGQRLVKRE